MRNTPKMTGKPEPASDSAIRMAVMEDRRAAGTGVDNSVISTAVHPSLGIHAGSMLRADTTTRWVAERAMVEEWIRRSFYRLSIDGTIYELRVVSIRGCVHSGPEIKSHWFPTDDTSLAEVR